MTRADSAEEMAGSAGTPEHEGAADQARREPERTDEAAGRVRVASSLDEMIELAPFVDVAQRPDSRGQVILSLGSSGGEDACLPDLAKGDRIEVCAEVEVTVDLTSNEATQNAAGGGKPTGKPYDYSPEVRAQLLLASSPSATLPSSSALRIGTQKVLAVSHTLHHHVFVYDGALFEIPASGLPWKGPTYLNLVLSANHSSAKAGHLVIVGQNNFDGSTGQNMASLAVIRSRAGGSPKPRVEQTAQLKTASMTIKKGPSKVVCSLPLSGLRANEQLRVRGDVIASFASGYPARLSTEMFLADSPTQDGPIGKSYAASLVSAKGKVSRGNGFNIVSAAPTRYAKAGTLRVTKDATRDVYLNLVCSAGDPKKYGRNDAIRFLSGSGIKVTRYAPENFG